MVKKFIGTMAAVLMFLSLFPAAAMAAVQDTDVLQVGDEDDSVRELQEKLLEGDYLTGTATGYFGRDTQNALIKFQQDNGLISDGKAGIETKRLLFGDGAESYGSAENEDTGGEDAESANFPLRPGDKGDIIQKIQVRLDELEYYQYESITGYYGPVTETAVKKFQRTHGMDANGLLDEESYSLLFSATAKYNEICLDDNGDLVEQLQQRLAELGYFEQEPTGYYGYNTVDAVRMFQNANDLQVDGRVDMDTRKLMFSANAKIYDKSADESGINTLISDPAASTGITKMLEVAKEQEGKPYSYGSSGPNSYDCAGFVYYVLKNSGVATTKLSAASYATLSGWETVSDISALSVGDLVFFTAENGSSINHMGIYLGGGSFIHASPSAECVKVSGMSSDYYLDNFATAKRIF